MTAEHGQEPVGLRAIKSFEEQGPVIVWQVGPPRGVDPKKLYLILDANQKSFGVRLDKIRSEDLKTAGAVVAQLRKQIPSGYIAGIFQEAASGHFWVPFFRERAPTPAYWLMLARVSPPEVRLIDAQKVIHVRKSSQGSYTKKRDLDQHLPEWPPREEYRDILPELLAPFYTDLEPPSWPDRTGDNLPSDRIDLQGAEGELESTDRSPASRDLPAYQKTARDRLARRLKTLRKSQQRLERERTQTGGIDALEQKARLLRDHLHLVTPGLSQLTVLDTSGLEYCIDLDTTLSPGVLLEKAFSAVKKARRAQSKLGEEVERAKKAVLQAELDLAHLREGPMALAVVQHMMARHHLALTKPSIVTRAGETPQALPYKTYLYRSERLKRPVRILVGKGAEGSDVLVKNAKANDLWFHIVGSTGSHVIIPVRDLGSETPPAELLRHAGILAVFHSKVRESHAGEVYLSRKQHIRKRKGMAAGLWQIDKAETTMMRFDDEELQLVLGMESHSAR